MLFCFVMRYYGITSQSISHVCRQYKNKQKTTQGLLLSLTAHSDKRSLCPSKHFFTPFCPIPLTTTWFLFDQRKTHKLISTQVVDKMFDTHSSVSN